MSPRSVHLLLLALFAFCSLHAGARSIRSVYQFGTSSLVTTATTGIPTASSSSSSMDSDATVGDSTHEYVRPSGGDVSGVPKNAAKNHRSPCPALNTLANHGYIPRDGKNLTPEMLARGVTEVFNIDPSLASTLTAGLPAQFTLADLGEHNFIEHDASLVHDDAFFGKDPASVNASLVQDLLARADDKGQITASSLAHFRRWREQQCAKDDPKYGLSYKQQLVAYGEAAVLLLAMGHYDSETISTDHARSFLEEERIPPAFAKSTTPVSKSTALYLALKLKWLASFGG